MIYVNLWRKGDKGSAWALKMYQAALISNSSTLDQITAKKLQDDRHWASVLCDVLVSNYNYLVTDAV